MSGTYVDNLCTLENYLQHDREIHELDYVQKYKPNDLQTVLDKYIAKYNLPADSNYYTVSHAITLVQNTKHKAFCSVLLSLARDHLEDEYDIISHSDLAEHYELRAL